MLRSGRQWTSHSRSSRHLCPVVVLDILSCVFIPPSFLWSCLPPLLSAVWHHHAAVSTSIKEPLGWTVYLSVCAFERGVNMEHKECCNPPPPPLPTSTVLISLQMDGLLGRYKTIHTHPHTHTTHLSDGCIPRPPAVSAAFDDVFNGFIHPKACSFFPFTSSSLSIYPSCWLLGQLCAKWQLIPSPTDLLTLLLDSPPLLLPTLTLIPCSFSLTSYSWSVPFPILLKAVCPPKKPLCLFVICLKITYTCFTVTLSLVTAAAVIQSNEIFPEKTHIINRMSSFWPTLMYQQSKENKNQLLTTIGIFVTFK